MTDFPFTNRITDVSFEHVTSTLVNRSPSGYREVINYGGGYWNVNLSIRPLKRTEADIFSAFMDANLAGFYPFNIIIPKYSYSKSDYTGSILVNGVSQTGRDILVDGMTANTNGILKTGDFIKFENNNKVYRLREDLNSNVSGEGTLKLHMPIVDVSPGDNDNVIFNSVPFRLSLSPNGTRVTEIDVNGFSSFTFSMEEVWN